jgi:ADP-heptose:LPS heptosyltransferase
VSGQHVLIVRPDGLGDVVLAGPAVRAVAADAARVTFLAGPRGAPMAALLPGVDDVLTWSPPWIEADPAPVDPGNIMRVVEQLAALGLDRALVLTSYHQNPLPTALLLRLAGVPWIGAMSEDYPGSLLDLRLAPTGDLPEPERSLRLVRAAGHELPAGDDGRLRTRVPRPLRRSPGRRRVVLHPGASAPARAWPSESYVELAHLLVDQHYDVLVTGSAREREVCSRVAGTIAKNMAAGTDAADLGRLLANVDVMVAGNTGPAHFAAAVGTPVVSLFAPTVPATRWAPYNVPHVLLGDQRAPCRDTRATACPIPGHPCLASITADEVAHAVERLTCEVEATS